MTGMSETTTPSVDIDHLRSWIGREQAKSDVITVRMAEMFNSIFNVDGPVAEGNDAPVGIQWCLAPDIVAMNGIGADGHPLRGGFLPPVPFPRRMWAGGELTCVGTFRIGDTVVRRSVIDDVTLKVGRSGSLIFVTVRHDYSSKTGLVLSERQDIVYRELDPGAPLEKPASAAAIAPAADGVKADVSMLVDASPTLLFRYSAVTFNSHRIHYDMPYVTTEEHYPGLVVHGPLQATLLLRLASERSGGALPKSFAFRSLRPLFAGPAFTVNAAGGHADDRLWVADAHGGTTMTATALR